MKLCLVLSFYANNISALYVCVCVFVCLYVEFPLSFQFFKTVNAVEEWKIWVKSSQKMSYIKVMEIIKI